ncbi:hypothetical protein N1031_06915 [Herbiconiux moechotypicola]|uniref:Head-to-tail adaptor n=1 Tax=Herbiconiux moechotypicola TaxID=637393 RepID=A0ABN3DG39_9MICO|nr:hypothetical protein [Herbiconiux moechotypicola]MCS5729487.1 hypothetical protein [Herbiconiux moechotypicola]
MANPLPPALSLLEKRLGVAPGSLAGEEKSRAEAALEDAATLVLAEVRDTLAAAWATDAPTVAVLVALKAARREFENPQGISSETVEGHAVGITDASGVFLTSREIALVHRAASGRRGGFVGTVRILTAYEDS